MKCPVRFIALMASLMASAPAQPAPVVAPTSPLTPTPPALETEQAVKERLELEKQKQFEARWSIRTDVLMVAVPLDRALQLLGELQTDDDRKVETAFAQIQEMIAKKQATFIAWPSLVSLDGQRAVVETIVEKRYPSEFIPPLTPSLSGLNLVDHANSGLPESWETRNIGTTLEVAATVLDEGKRIHVDLLPQRVGLIGWKTYKVGKKDVGLVDIDQPEFATQKVTSSLSIRNGARVLIAAHHMELPTDQIEFFILHAKATPVK
jgi:hypothetical protein